MRKFVLLALFFLTSFQLAAQEIKLLDSYLRGNDLSTRYVAVLEDNSIWWFAPGQEWQKSSTS